MPPKGPLPPRPASRARFSPASALDLPLVVLREEEEWVVVVKPAGLLSVPGSEPWAADAASERVRALFPRARGGLVAHRLDMATSGVMVFALSPRALAALNRDFEAKRVHKRYAAVVSAPLDRLDRLAAARGDLIDLPLRLDPFHRPLQVVDPLLGKPTLTRWAPAAAHPLGALVHLWPVTGKTHQLRLHAAHPLGLGAPIVGDAIYHREANMGAEGAVAVGGARRLLLHAEELTFLDPLTRAPVTCRAPAPFTDAPLADLPLADAAPSPLSPHSPGDAPHVLSAQPRRREL
ncbi:MAG: RluA family pseudouridine synthase [Deltaproteobacteria bacterium]|nr:RluA family pseudouridine synthase [Deltaproteobacteria bacterium]